MAIQAEQRLPDRIAIPPESICKEGRHLGYWKYVRGTIEALSPQTKLEITDRVGRIGWSSFEILVDDHVAVVDYSDFQHVDPQFRRYRHWLRFHHTPAMVPYPNLGSFPPWSFLDWREYHRVLANHSYSATGNTIIYRHSRLANRLPNLVQRRTRAMRLLKAHCGDRLKTGYVPQEKYFQECLTSRAVVHIPGSHPHILDRTAQQMLGLGVCLISPDLWTSCLEERPQAGLHYVPILDDYSDLPEKIDWVTHHREEAIKIGMAGQQFFQSHCLPHAIWAYVQERMMQNHSHDAITEQQGGRPPVNFR